MGAIGTHRMADPSQEDPDVPIAVPRILRRERPHRGHRRFSAQAAGGASRPPAPTCPRFSEEQVVTILREADQRPIADVAKRHGISDRTIYA
jgi:hypothetical protein